MTPADSTRLAINCLPGKGQTTVGNPEATTLVPVQGGSIVTIKNSTTKTTTDQSTGESGYTVGNVAQVDPATLLLLSNVREAKPDKGLVESIKAVGVLEPITAMLTASGDLEVRYGFRRTLAACQAQQSTVPVYVAGHAGAAADEKQAQAQEVDRIVRQRDENTHRAGLNTTDEISIVGQLAAFGLSPNQIAKKARIPRRDVDDSLTILGSDLAQAATMRYEALTLDQAATVAEFEDDTETVKALVAASAVGRFEHVAQQARDQRRDRQAKAEATTTLAATGVTIIEAPGYDDPALPLNRLIDTDDTTGTILTEEAHGECPGRVAWLDTEWTLVGPDGKPLDDDADAEDNADAREVLMWVPVHGCANPTEHAHRDRYGVSGGTGSKVPAAQMSEAERQEAKAARRLVIENNKAWVSAETVRREWVKTYLTRKSAPKGTAAFLASTLVRDAASLADVGANHLATEWAGAKPPAYGYADQIATQAEKATEARALVLALGYVLACYEKNLTKDSWRTDGTHSAAGRYLRFLATCGYTLSDVETYAASPKTA